MSERCVSVSGVRVWTGLRRVRTRVGEELPYASIVSWRAKSTRASDVAPHVHVCSSFYMERDSLGLGLVKCAWYESARMVRGAPDSPLADLVWDC